MRNRHAIEAKWGKNSGCSSLRQKIALNEAKLDGIEAKELSASLQNGYEAKQAGFPIFSFCPINDFRNKGVAA